MGPLSVTAAAAVTRPGERRAAAAGVDRTGSWLAAGARRPLGPSSGSAADVSVRRAVTRVVGPLTPDTHRSADLRPSRCPLRGWLGLLIRQGEVFLVWGVDPLGPIVPWCCALLCLGPRAAACLGLARGSASLGCRPARRDDALRRRAAASCLIGAERPAAAVRRFRRRVNWVTDRRQTAASRTDGRPADGALTWKGAPAAV